MILWTTSLPSFTRSWAPEMKLCGNSRVQTISLATSALSDPSTLPCHCALQQRCLLSECSTTPLTLHHLDGADASFRCANLQLPGSIPSLDSCHHSTLCCRRSHDYHAEPLANWLIYRGYG